MSGSRRSSAAIAVFPTPEAPDRTTSSPRGSLSVRRLLLQPLDRDLHVHDGARDLRVLALAADGVDLAAELLAQELQAPAERAALAERVAPLLHMARQARDLLGDVGPVGEHGHLARDEFRGDGRVAE